MKYFASVLISLLGFIGTIAAQDTLSADTLKSSYYCREWYDFTTRECILLNRQHLVSRNDKPLGHFVELDDGDTITVYGMAVGVETYDLPIYQSVIWGDNHDIAGYYDDSSYYYDQLNAMCDSSAYGEAYELWGLYKRVADSLQLVSPQLPIYIKLQRPSYILTFSTYKDGTCTEHTPPVPVYELFFHTPQVMDGSFYMAMTNRIHQKGSECHKSYYTWPIFRRMVMPSGIPPIWRGEAIYQNYPNQSEGQWYFDDHGFSVIAFPIIAPPDSGYVWDTTVVAHDTVAANGDTLLCMPGDTIVPATDTTLIVGTDTIFVPAGTPIVSDTTITLDSLVLQDTAIVGGDTLVYFDTIVTYDTAVGYSVLLSITEADMAGRFTLVKPNPAAESVKVVSSVGMSRVEVFGMAGKRIFNCAVASGEMAVTLDVGRWPAGTYLVRIHTPIGTATKRLTVSR